MCGIAGFNEAALTGAKARAVLERMGASIAHRGPDAGASYLDDSIALRHQRLSIIDTSEMGLQPMASRSGRYITVFNGEIYNFQSLRRELELEGAVFRGHSDTEVLLALYERDGSQCLKKLNGMFALAIWDTHAKSLFLARDRLGKKPLYVWRQGTKIAFASEIKALLNVPGVEKKLRMDAVKDYFTYQYIPDPKTIFESIEKLPPGHMMSFDSTGEVVLEQWWDVSFATTRTENDEDLVEELGALIDDSVKLRMVSDVALGAFLSGGVDSSAVVGYMAGHSERPVTTCSVGFESEEHDETIHAQAVADLFNTDHRKFVVEGDVAERLVSVSRYFDEPFADASFLPTYFVSQMARQAVTVALAGDGGDESFGGYAKYATYEREIRWRSRAPKGMPQKMMAGVSSLLSGSRLPNVQRGSNLLRSMSADNDMGFFICNSFFRDDIWNELAKGEVQANTLDYKPSSLTLEHFNRADTDDPMARALYTDLKTYLPGDILVKVDRMSMANSLECRAPLLDYRIVEFAASLPMNKKRHNGTSKYILKKTLGKMLPESILHRRKMGFESPIAAWLRGSLRETFEKYVFSSNAASQQMFNQKPLQDLWRQHQSGTNTYVNELWSIFMFELWWSHYMEE